MSGLIPATDLYFALDNHSGIQREKGEALFKYMQSTHLKAPELCLNLLGFYLKM